MAKIPTSGTTWRQRVYMLWLLTRIYLLATEDAEEVPGNINTLHSTWANMGGKFEQKSHDEMRREIVETIKKALRRD